MSTAKLQIIALLVPLSLAACSRSELPALALLAPSQDAPAARKAASDTAIPAAAPVAKPAAWRTELLDLAFDAASAFPLYPHIKNRSRAQADVVLAALELDQPEAAERYASGIMNWRRGEALAAIAYHQAERGRLDRVDELLAAADSIAKTGTVPRSEPHASDRIESQQEWRSDRIRARIASTYVLLGKNNLADATAFGSVEAETAPILAERASKVSGEHFDQHMERLEPLVATGSFDSLRSALGSYTRLFERFYVDVERRTRVEEKIHVAWAKLPLQVRAEVQGELVETAIEKQDPAKAHQLLDDAAAMLAGVEDHAESGVPVLARLAALRARAGDATKASAETDVALKAYESGRAGIVNLFRAGVLRPVAEAYRALGDLERTRALYARVLEEGAENPNARPRCDDLVATVCSLVVHDVEPDAALAKRIREIRAGLTEPW